MLKQGEVNIRLKSLREVPGSFELNRRLVRHYGGEPVDVSLSVRLEQASAETVSMVMEVTYHVVRSYIRETMLRYKVQSDFMIDRMDEHIAAKGVDAVVSNRLMSLMLGVTLGSLRGMLALRTASTPLADYPLPIFNISELVSRLHYGDAPSDATRPIFNYIYN